MDVRHLGRSRHDLGACVGERGARNRARGSPELRVELRDDGIRHAGRRVHRLPEAVVEIRRDRLGDRRQPSSPGRRDRDRVLTASVRTAFCWESAGVAPIVRKSMCPPIRSPSAGVEPLYGTWVASTPSRSTSSAAHRCVALPTPADPYVVPLLVDR
jgi:hypothetical protein